jgi:hypothetical protein
MIEIVVVVALMGILALVGVKGLFDGSLTPREILDRAFPDGRQESVSSGEILSLRLTPEGELGLYPLNALEPLERYAPPKDSKWRLEPEELYFFPEGSLSPGLVYLDRKGKDPAVFWITVTGQVVPGGAS